MCSSPRSAAASRWARRRPTCSECAWQGRPPAAGARPAGAALVLDPALPSRSFNQFNAHCSNGCSSPSPSCPQVLCTGQGGGRAHLRDHAARACDRHERRGCAACHSGWVGWPALQLPAAPHACCTPVCCLQAPPATSSSNPLCRLARPAGETLKQVEGRLDFSDVTFAYPSRPGAPTSLHSPAAGWLSSARQTSAVKRFASIPGLPPQTSRCSATLS